MNNTNNNNLAKSYTCPVEESKSQQDVRREALLPLSGPNNENKLLRSRSSHTILRRSASLNQEMTKRRTTVMLENNLQTSGLMSPREIVVKEWNRKNSLSAMAPIKNSQKSIKFKKS